jgi:cytochrome P450
MGRALNVPDLSSPGTYLPDPPHDLWRRLREMGELYWQHRPDAPGFYSAVRYDHADRVLRDAETYSSEWGMTLDSAIGRPDPAAGLMIELTDPPRHQRLRRIVSHAFGRRSVDELEANLRTRVSRWAAAAAAATTTDFVSAIAARVPAAAAGILLGIPEDDWQRVARVASRAICGDRAEHDEPGDLAARRQATNVANEQLLAYFVDLVDGGDGKLSDGLILRLMNAELDGTKLTGDEVILNCLNLVIGGNETTKNAAAAGMVLFAQHPDKWKWLRRNPDRVGAAVEEVLRYATPPLHLVRTVTRDTTLGSRELAPGDLVCVWLPSANRDADVFGQPDAFVIDREPNPHLAFTSGRHFCLGAALARLELRLVFEELLDRVAEMHILAPPQRRASNFIASIDRLDLAFECAEPVYV